ncbi:MAG: DNA polymerase I [Calditrichaeota bacterium]|nr:MAG: DNA polymerase I [Calditrichota bacterium]MBL1204422.1 DNA polymerase I [Calditrichota bacterium]NOG44251.1 DNA polymerase I [Calditrichota bacterium]
MSEKLFLIDGSALYYRSYFAFIRNPLINSKGENTSATFGFLNTMIKILDEERPEYVAIIFDTSKPTFRHEIYSEYKATREKMPDDMRAQYPRMVDTLKKLNFILIDKDGYEADDIIGMLSHKYGNKDLDVFIVSGDKDMAQLVNDHVFLYAVGKAGAAPDIMNAQKVIDKYGVNPSQIVDWLALMGDTSDNIPGVPKVGGKTAAKLLGEYGSIPGIYENLEGMKKSALKDNLANNKEQAFMSQNLTTIDLKVPMDVMLDDIKFNVWDMDVVSKILKELEFPSLFNRMLALTEADSDFIPTDTSQYEKEAVNYKLVDTKESFDGFLKELKRQKKFVFDLETDSLDSLTANIAGIAFSWKEHQGWYVPINHFDIKLSEKEILRSLTPVFTNPKIKKYGQNLKYDHAVLKQHGVNVQGIYFDTMIASYVLDPSNRQHNLDNLAEKYLAYKMIPISDLIGKGKDEKLMTDLAANEVLPYAAEDADISLRVANILEDKLKEHGLDDLFFNLEMPLLEVLEITETNGIKINLDLLSKLSEDIAKELAKLEKEIYDFAGQEFNISSPQQLGTIMFEEKKIHEELDLRKPKKTKTGQFSTSEQTLERFSEHPVIDKILNFRKLAKLKNTYVDALPEMVNSKTGKIHTSYNQTVAATGRLSSMNPNLQNIPIRTELGKEIRRAFIPSREGYSILSADYSQIELRVMAHLSGDETLIKGFQQDNTDIHAVTASLIFDISLEEVTADHRRKAKEINFGIMYGMNKWGLSNRLHISPDEAELFIANYFATYPNIQLFMRKAIEQANEQGYVETMMNRRRYLPEIKSKNRNIREFAERMAINTPIQGSAADLIKKAMIDMQRFIDTQEDCPAYMLMQVHDELVFEVKDSYIKEFAGHVERIMANAMPLSVPVVVESASGANWLEAHE